jgi:hypothetical protein
MNVLLLLLLITFLIELNGVMVTKILLLNLKNQLLMLKKLKSQKHLFIKLQKLAAYSNNHTLKNVIFQKLNGTQLSKWLDILKMMYALFMSRLVEFHVTIGV